MNGEILQKIKVYLQRIRPLFKNGFLRLISEDQKVKIMYKTNFGEFTQKESLDFSQEETFEKVIDFALDCFFYFERDGEKMKSEEIAPLLWIAPSTARGILFKIYKKLKKSSDDWKFFLS